MNFASTIIAASVVGAQAHAARDTFAAHRMALESILHEQPHHEAPVHHNYAHEAPHHEAPVHHNYAHEAPHHEAPAHHNYAHEAPHHEAPAHHNYAHEAPRHEAPHHNYSYDHVSRHEQPHHEAPVHHNYAHEAPHHEAPRHNYTHEAPAHHRNQHHETEYVDFPDQHTREVYHRGYDEDDYSHHEPVETHDYDAFAHDEDTERTPHISYRHHGDDEWKKEKPCGDREYCHRFASMLARDHKEFSHQYGEHSYRDEEHFENNMKSNHLSQAYYVVPDSLVVHEDAIHAQLYLHEHEYFNGMEFRAAHLDLHVALFQEGIMQVKIKASGEEERFSISNTGIGIDWDNIKVQQHLHDFVKILDDGILISGQDKVSYKIQFDPFRIIQYVDGHETIIVNDNDNLYYDAKDLGATHHADAHHDKVEAHPAAHADEHANAAEKAAKDTKAPKKAEAKKPASSVVQGYSVGMDFTVNATHMYGIPQRADNFRLEETGFDHPYRLFN